MPRIKRVRPQRPSRFKTKAKILGRKVKPLEVKRMELISKINTSKEEEMSYEEFCKPFNEIKKVLKNKGITSEEMQKRHERSRREYYAKRNTR